MFGLFKNDPGKKAISSAEYDFILNRVAEINSSIKSLKSDVENLQTNVSSLRGKFNQRLRGEKDTGTTGQTAGSEELEGFNNSNELPLG